MPNEDLYSPRMVATKRKIQINKQQTTHTHTHTHNKRYSYNKLQKCGITLQLRAGQALFCMALLILYVCTYIINVVFSGFYFYSYMYINVVWKWQDAPSYLSCNCYCPGVTHCRCVEHFVEVGEWRSTMSETSSLVSRWYQFLFHLLWK